MKIKLYADYPNYTWNVFPKYIEWVKEDCGLSCYADAYIRSEHIDDNSIALVIEPRTIQPELYKYIENNYHKFKYVFTSDEILINSISNGLPIVFGGVYSTSDKPKTKNISMISSDKKYCDLHRQRIDLARKLRKSGLVDCYGTFDGGSWISTEDAHSEYRFAVVLENNITDYWFTEKVCNCFANKTIPIYYGARKIGEHFNVDGMIIVNSISEIPALIESLDCEDEYNKRISAVNDNFERVKNYHCFEDIFYSMYHNLLEELKETKYENKD